MTLRRPRSPKSHAPVLQEAGESLRLGERRAPETKPRREPEVQDRVPVFTAGLQSLLHPGGLSRTQRSSWRYLIRAGRGPTHVMDIADAPQAAKPVTLTQVRHGESVQRLRKHIRACERDKRFKRRAYVVRLLRIPALHFSALWLKADSKKNDIFIPHRSLYKGLRIGHRYSLEQLESVLRPAAERVLNFKF
jgi:hypothetical protein